MTRTFKPIRLAIVLLVIALLAACGPTAPSPEEIAAQIHTAVAQTMEAQAQIDQSVAMTVSARETEAAGALPSPTNTPPETQPTLTPFLPTATPFELITPASSGGGGSGGSGGSSAQEYDCDVIHQRPFDNTVYRPNDPFDIRFTILNTGTKTWEAGKDLIYSSGPNLIVSPAYATLQLPEMKPGGTFDVGPYDAQAPSTPGHYVMEFKLEGGFCWPYIAIDVK